MIDPHGDLVEDVLAFTPKERAQDMIIFDPSDYERPLGLNMLDLIATEPALQAIEKDRAALDATSIWKSRDRPLPTVAQSQDPQNLLVGRK